jgi:predicted Zn-dependent protease
MPRLSPYSSPFCRTVLLLLLPAVQVLGHGDVHEGIVRLTQEIEGRPEAAGLRLERAGLYMHHGEYENALGDLAQVEAVEPGNDFPQALRGEVLRRMGRLVEARAAQEAFLKKYPQQAQVRWEYCRTLADAKDTASAQRELDALIAAAEHPSPDAVALRLSVTESAGPDGKAAALRWLNGFLEKHPLPVFHEHALRLETAMGRTADAMARLERMIAAAPRQEVLLLRKAALCRAAGDEAGAVTAARAAQEAMARLPEHVRNTPATAALMAQVPQYLSSKSPAMNPASAALRQPP